MPKRKKKPEEPILYSCVNRKRCLDGTYTPYYVAGHTVRFSFFPEDLHSLHYTEVRQNNALHETKAQRKLRREYEFKHRTIYWDDRWEDDAIDTSCLCRKGIREAASNLKSSAGELHDMPVLVDWMLEELE